MCILRDSHTETGMATLIVIMIIVVMGVLLAGLIPLGTTVTHSAAYTRNALQAQYIAEAGAKRAIAALGAGSTDWNWLGSASWHDVVNNPSIRSRYAVSISGSTGPLSGTGAPADDTYTVTSSGQYGNFSKTVTVRVAVTTGGFTDVESSFAIGGNITNPTGTRHEFSSNGEVVYAGTLDDGSKILLGGSLGTNNNHAFLNQNTVLDIAEFDVNDALSRATEEFPVKQESNEKVELAGGTYYSYNGDLVLNTNNNYDFYGSTSDAEANPDHSNQYAVVVVNGDLTINATGAVHISDNVVFLVAGDFIFDSSSTELRDVCVYCNGDAYIKKARSNATIQMIVDGSLIFENDLTNSNPCENEGLIDFLNSQSSEKRITVSNWAQGT